MFVYQYYSFYLKKNNNVCSITFQRATLSNPNKMNETEARIICEETFAKAPIINLSTKLIPEDQFLKDCIIDLKVK